MRQTGDLLRTSRVRKPVAWLLALAGLAACSDGPPTRTLPPSASDLVLLKSAKPCDRKPDFLKAHPGSSVQRQPWGTGEELRIPGAQSASKADESYFFDEDGLLAGVLFVFPGGLSLDPYPVLKQTIMQLKPDVQFYVSLAQAPDKGGFNSSSLYRTGDEKSTTQYIIHGRIESASLVSASFSLDPYALLLSPYRKEFLSRVSGFDKVKGTKADVRGFEDKEPFGSLQQFARGETAQLAYCAAGDPAVAATAYSKAIAGGFTDKVQLSEAHHKLGLAYKRQGRLKLAVDAMQQALAIYPSRPDVLNNLGDTYRAMGEDKKALAAFDKAVTLKPNYPVARFNLAEAYETVNPKLAIEAYETYLALAEGIPEEHERVARAKHKLEKMAKRK